ncbi:MAG: GtrA family protein [Candidatus Aminicenantes bacterium]|nr:GtrA family protein [Candidatus Aminicenantes bacterium]
MLGKLYLFAQRFMDLRFLKFLAVGLTTMVVQFSSFAMMWDIFHLPQRLSVSISYIAAVTFHFLSNRFFTFQAGNADVFKQLIKYIIIVCLNYIITIVVVDVCVKTLFLSPYIGVMAAIATTVMTGFLFLKYWVFGEASRLGKAKQLER